MVWHDYFHEILLINSSKTVNRMMCSKYLHNSYTMGCPPVGGDNPQALESGLS